MKRCHACHKITFMPEQIVNIRLCKRCFFKIDGFLWKYIKIEKGETLEKYKNKALEKARKNNFPEKVITALEQYFNYNHSKMKKCDICGEEKQTISNLHGSLICKKCCNKLGIHEDFNNYYFSNREEFNNSKRHVINAAKSKKVPKNIIDNITLAYNEKVSDDWIRTYYGDFEQYIELYNEYLVINTTDKFDFENMSFIYNEELKKIMVNREFSKNLLNIFNIFSDVSMKKVEDDAKKKYSFCVKPGRTKIYYKDCEELAVKMPGSSRKMLSGPSFPNQAFIIIFYKTQNGNNDKAMFFFMDRTEMNDIKKFIENKMKNNKIDKE